MLVDIESVALHARMAELFGTPTPTTHDDEEWFGPYVVDGHTKFWCYDSPLKTWSVVAAQTEQTEVRTEGGVPIREVQEAEEAIKTASLVPVPAYPTDDKNVRNTMWFSHAGCMFTWNLDRQHKEWQLRFGGRQ